MTILNDFKAFLVLNKVVDESQVAFNFDDYKFGSDKLIIRCTGGEYKDKEKDGRHVFVFDLKVVHKK